LGRTERGISFEVLVLGFEVFVLGFEVFVLGFEVFVPERAQIRVVSREE